VTLVELLIALAITGVAMLGGMLLLDQVNDSNRRISSDSVHDAESGNGDRFLRRLFADVRETTDTAQRFRGEERTARYLTLCDTPGGWAERCLALVSIDSLRDSSVIVAETDLGDRFEVRRMAGSATFRYLDPASPPESSWVRRWATSILPPAALALVVPDGDTTVLPVGSVRD
jgi:hypothetical protein